MYFYYACLLALSILQLGPRRTVLPRLALVGVALFLIAGLRASGVDHDYEGYIEYYNDVLYQDFLNVEPAFSVLANVVKLLGDNSLYLFLIYAALGILLKVVAMYRLTPYPLSALLIYFSGFFLLWEMTQIRAAIAGGILLLCLPRIRDRNLLAFLSLCLLAVVFHYSALIFLPLYFLDPQKINKVLYVCVIPLAAALNHFDLNVVELASFSPIQLIELKVNSYANYAQLETPNTFNGLFMARCLLAYALLLKSDFLTEKNRYFPLLIKVYFFGLFTHVALASVPGIGSRLSELLLVTEVILIPMLVHFFRMRHEGYFVVTLAGLTFLVFSLHYADLMGPYRVSGFGPQ